MNSSKINIRKIKTSEIEILDDMLYESIYQSDKTTPIPREVINEPRVYAYINNFGKKEDDYCLVADFNGKIIGAVWVRILASKIKGYGNVDDKTPEFAIALYKEYRKQGTGTLLMQKMILYLKEEGYKQTSLSVQKDNYAVGLYQKLGFKTIGENNEDYIMLLKF